MLTATAARPVATRLAEITAESVGFSAYSGHGAADTLAVVTQVNHAALWVNGLSFEADTTAQGFAFRWVCVDFPAHDDDLGSYTEQLSLPVVFEEGVTVAAVLQALIALRLVPASATVCNLTSPAAFTEF